MSNCLQSNLPCEPFLPDCPFLPLYPVGPSIPCDPFSPASPMEPLKFVSKAKGVSLFLQADRKYLKEIAERQLKQGSQKRNNIQKCF